MLVIVIISALAAARVWRCLVTDDVGIKLRDAVDGWPRLAREGYYCPWCMGFWICAAFILIAVTSPGWLFLLIAGPFAANYLSASLNVRNKDH